MLSKVYNQEYIKEGRDQLEYRTVTVYTACEMYAESNMTPLCTLGTILVQFNSILRDKDNLPQRTRSRSQCVRYSEVPLYMAIYTSKSLYTLDTSSAHNVTRTR